MSTPVFLIKLEDLILPMYTQHFVALHNSIGHQSAGVRLACRGHSYLQCSSFWYCLWAMFGSKFGCTGPHAKLNCDGNRSSSISPSCHRQGTIGQHICFTPSLISSRVCTARADVLCAYSLSRQQLAKACSYFARNAVTSLWVTLSCAHHTVRTSILIMID